MIRFTVALVALALTRLQIRTKAGTDFWAGVLGNTSSNGTGAYAPACYIALSEDDSAPDEDNTTLAGEISSGTLARAQGIYAHTTGTNLFTITKSFTSDSEVTIARIGVFNASSGGTLVYEDLLDAPVPMRSGDTCQFTHAVTL